MSYHVENAFFKELPEQLIVREDGYMDAYKNGGVPIVDYVYTLQEEDDAILDYRASQVAAEGNRIPEQAVSLRALADRLRGVRFEDQANYVENVETIYLSMGALREAADTIEKLSQVIECKPAIGGTQDKSNYEKLFGTPEKAARTLVEFFEIDQISLCLSLLEWLGSDAECDATSRFLQFVKRGERSRLM